VCRWWWWFVSGLVGEQDACLVMRETQASGSGAWAGMAE
jgi:hypothetical protein